MYINDIVGEIEYRINKAFISQNPELLDVIFEIEGKKLYADKLRLAVISSTFKSMLSDHWHPNTDEAIKIDTYRFKDFKEFLTFIYSGKCNITDSNVFTLLDMAEFYQLSHLKEICDDYLAQTHIKSSRIFHFMEISCCYSLIKTKKSTQPYISQNIKDLIASEAFAEAKRIVIQELVTFEPDLINSEDLFQVVYQWSEHQAIKKQKESNDENFNKNEAIKAEISPFLPCIKFKKMKMEFLIKFVVKKASFLFSGDTLSDILDYVYSLQQIKITNSYGRSLIGFVPNDSEVIEIVKNLNNRPSDNSASNTIIFWKRSCQVFSFPNRLKKTNGVEWYLVYFTDGDVGVRKSSLIQSNDYLLAEMSPKNGDFVITKNCKIEIM